MHIQLNLLAQVLSITFTLQVTACKGNSESPMRTTVYSSPSSEDSILATAGQHYKKNKLFNFLFGKHYRPLWTQPVKVEVFDLTEENGGFKIIKKGGSQQTLNLRMEDRSGHEYVLRTVDKDQSKVLPPFLRNTFIAPAFKDQASALNPYASIIIPPLAEAAGIYHTTPKLYYVPKNPGFGKYSPEFKERMVIVEEHPGDTWAASEKFGAPADIVSSEDMLKERFTNPKTRIDTRLYARNRLFDILIGDWDRHSDQWKWAKHELGKEEVLFQPIPRDRDIAFFKFDDGFLTFLTTLIVPKFQSFHFCITDMKGMIKNARYLDQLLLPPLSQEDWQAIAYDLQKSITDSVIEQAVRQWPGEVYELVGKETEAKLKLRRNQLGEIALVFSQLVNKNPIVAGTDRREYIEIIRTNEQTRVSIYDNSQKELLIYTNSFDNLITEDIEIRGLGGSDEFVVEGDVDKGILVKLYGGEGRDEYTDRSNVRGVLKKTRIYDSQGENILSIGTEAEDNTTEEPLAYEFNKTGKKKKWWRDE